MSHRRVDGRGRYGKEYGNGLVQRTLLLGGELESIRNVSMIYVYDAKVFQGICLYFQISHRVNLKPTTMQKRKFLGITMDMF